MQRLEYRTLDKAAWGDGPWQSEPDKLQWQDKATGYPCLIVRGPVGALCGYVGVPKTHQLHGVGYSDCPKGCGQDWCDHRPESFLEAHGGITFAGGCSHPNEEGWRKAQKRCMDSIDEMKKFPRGDAAQFVREWGPSLKTYEGYVTKKQQSSICHIPSLGEPDDVWWFGFDCAHSGDFWPRRAEWASPSYVKDDVYRDVAYVTAQCASLAQQLKQKEQS